MRMRLWICAVVMALAASASLSKEPVKAVTRKSASGRASTVKKGCIVRVAFVMKDGNGDLIDEAGIGDGYSYIQGYGDGFPGMDAALEGKRIGDTLSFVVPARKAYGLRSDELVRRLPKTALPPEMRRVEVGELLQVDVGRGKWGAVTVKEVTPTHFVIDGNHERAGIDLHYQVQVLDLRKATAAEIEESRRRLKY